jgi:plasmid maintenance system antidote protein VapI
LITRVFELAESYGYKNNKELALAMGVHESMLTRVRQGKIGITHRFIAGARRAFPDKTLDELFQVDSDVA